MALATTNGSLSPAPPSGVPGVATAREAENQAVGALLARANLFRMRGQWDEAIAVCTEALRRFPESPTAHSLLGDIYEAQNKLDDALQWFGMAVDLDPANAADRAKLDRVVQIQRAKLLAEQKSSVPSLANGAALSSPASRPQTEKTLEWIDRMFPPGKSESIARLILVFSGGVAVLLLGAAAFVYFLLRPAPSTGPMRPVLQPAPIVVVPPAMPRSSVPARPAAPAAVPSPIAPQPSAGSASDDRTNSAFAAAVSQSLAGSGIQITAAQVEAATGEATLYLALPVISGETVDKTRERIVRAGTRAALASAQTNPRLQRATLHIGLSATPNAPPVEAFAGDIALASLTGLDAAAAPVSDLLSRFARLQWEPSLVLSTTPTIVPPAASAGSAGSPPAGN